MKVLFSFIPELSRMLSNDLMGTLTLFLRLEFFFVTRTFFNIRNDFKVQVHFNDHKFSLYLRTVADISVLKEIYIDQEYLWNLEGNPKIILDLGAHFGDTTLYYHVMYPDAVIYAIEPAPENFERLVKNTKNIPNIFCIQAAVGVSDRTVDLHLMSSTLGNSTMERKGNLSKVRVRQVTLDTLYKEYDIGKADLIKFDVEGAEFDILQNIEPKNVSKAFIGELHFDLGNNVNMHDLSSFSDNSNLELIYIKKNRYMLKAQFV